MTREKFLERLTGSEKQIAWAKDIIQRVLFDKFHEDYEMTMNVSYDPEMREAVAAMERRIEEYRLSEIAKDFSWTREARKWIDRSRSDLSFLHRPSIIYINRIFEIEQQMITIPYTTRWIRKNHRDFEYPVFKVQPYSEWMEKHGARNGKANSWKRSIFLRYRSTSSKIFSQFLKKYGLDRNGKAPEEYYEFKK